MPRKRRITHPPMFIGRTEMEVIGPIFSPDKGRVGTVRDVIYGEDYTHVQLTFTNGWSTYDLAEVRPL